MTADDLAVVELMLDGFLDVAALGGLFTTSAKPATAGHFHDRGNIAWNRVKPFVARTGYCWQRCQQASCVRMLRVVKDLLDRADFLDSSSVHHNRALACLGSRNDIVRCIGLVRSK